MEYKLYMENDLFDEFVQTFLVERKDFLSNSDREVVSLETLNEALQSFEENPCERNRRIEFSDRIELFKHLREEAQIVFAHAFWLYTMPHKGMGALAKRKNLELILGNISDYKLRDDIFLDKEGVANLSAAYGPQKCHSIFFLLMLFKWIKNSPAGTEFASIRKAIINISLYGCYDDKSYLEESFVPEKTRYIVEGFKEFRTQKGSISKLGIFHFLLNLSDKDYYQRIINVEEKDDRAKQFKLQYIEGEDIKPEDMNTDDKLYYIHKYLKTIFNDPDPDSPYHFLDPNSPLRDDRLKEFWKGAGEESFKYRPSGGKMAEKSGFTWVQTHKEIAEYLKAMQERQPELISELKKAGVTSITDMDADGNYFDLEEMDPFSFFFYIYKYGQQMRLEVLQKLAGNLGVSIPSDTDGVPSAMAMKARVFPNKADRHQNEIMRLWDFFFKAISHQLADDDFADILTILSLGRVKLTEALFMVDPEHYLCIDGQTIPYLEQKLGINPEFETFTEYMALLERIREKTEMPFPELSYVSWKWNTQKVGTKFWVFQGNPKIFDIVGALKKGVISNWRVTSHEKNITNGDKIILWVTGNDAGCYALGDVDGDVKIGVRDLEESEFYRDDSYNIPHNRVAIKITHNLAERPILKEQVDKVKELEELKVGRQGTNFSATKEQYEALERLANTSGRRYWIFSPGEDGRKWDEFSQQGIIAIGWDSLGDLSQFASKEEIEAELIRQSGESDKRKVNDALANWQFKREMKVGDIVIAKKGQKVLLGYGEVTSDFKFSPDRAEYKKFREVLWLKKGEWEVGESVNLVVKTLTDITDYHTEHPGFTWYWERLLAVMDGRMVLDSFPAEPEDESDRSSQKPRYPLNQILYGPPGTGKTYNSINIAVEIADPDFMTKARTRPQVKNRYQELVNDGRIVFCTFHQSMGYEDFVEGIKPVTTEADENNISYEVLPGIFKTLSEGAAKSVANPNGEFSEASAGGNFILIIDEINRGNISQIFGELITLIEKDKRAGKEEALEVTLPYSKEIFSVPSNLYIIGTMNTADRSVEALDTALRRRFTFKEFQPLYEIFGDDGSDLLAQELCGYPLKEILKTLNNRIKILLDRDHQIGHSYFLGLENAEELMEVFNQNIIPLLQEYFYGDYARIGLVLGKGFVKKETLGEKDISTFEYDDVESLVKENYQLVLFDKVDEFRAALESMMAN